MKPRASSQATKVTNIYFGAYMFSIHSKRIPEGYEGYVVCRNEYICALPIAATERELLDKAEARLKELRL